MYSYVKINGIPVAVEKNLVVDGKISFPFEGNFVELDGVDPVKFELVTDLGSVVYAFKSSHPKEEIVKILRQYGAVFEVGEGFYVVGATAGEIIRDIYLGVEHLPEKTDDLHIKVFARYMETLGIKTVKFLTV